MNDRLQVEIERRKSSKAILCSVLVGQCYNKISFFFYSLSFFSLITIQIKYLYSWYQIMKYIKLWKIIHQIIITDNQQQKPYTKSMLINAWHA